MKRFQRTVAACISALIAMSVVAQPRPDKAPPRGKSAKSAPISYKSKADIVITEEMMKKFLLFMQLRSVLFTPPVSCVLQPGGVCVIDVPVILVPDPSTPGTDYCVALFPEKVSISGTSSTTTEKTIIWSLIPPAAAPAGATFTFFDDKAAVGKAPGIIILTDTNKQLHNGTIGDGTTSTPDPTKWLIKNKHKIKGEAVYIPVIVRTDNAGTPSEKVSVCGTPDPRITND